MIKTGLGRATKQFFLTTTLHGFKYLCSEFHSDRVCWLTWCVASACCAGALCAVLWARFLQVPALLAVRSATAAPAPMPALGVCLPPTSVAYLLLKHLSTDDQVIRRLSLTFSYILQGKQTKTENVMLLEELLSAKNVTVLDALYNNMPPCHKFAKRCRWQETVVPCGELFHRELTEFGVCCVLQPTRLKQTKTPQIQSLFHSNRHIGLVLECSNASQFLGCQFFAKYDDEETVNPVTLVPGSEYEAQLTFTAVEDSGSEELVTTSCVSSDAYSRKRCMDTCMERFCGCSNPLRTIFEDEVNVPPPCPLRQINCLLKTEKSCSCMPSCKKLSTDLSLEDNIMKSVKHTIDPLYTGLNVSSSTVVKFMVYEAGSKIFTRQPTESWFTLLSSLGGVFNMFLGVGLFSALELVFFILVRVPAAIKTLPEMHVHVTHVQTQSRAQYR